MPQKRGEDGAGPARKKEGGSGFGERLERLQKQIEAGLRSNDPQQVEEGRRQLRLFMTRTKKRLEKKFARLGRDKDAFGKWLEQDSESAQGASFARGLLEAALNGAKKMARKAAEAWRD